MNFKNRSVTGMTIVLCALSMVGCSKSDEAKGGEVAKNSPKADPEKASPKKVDVTKKVDTPVKVEGTELATLLADPSRREADRARDAGRKPAEVIAFLGIEPGMKVIDVIAGGGYYTEVLSLAVGPSGRVSTQNPDFVLKMRDGANDVQLSERLSDKRLPNVDRLDKELPEVSPPGQFDAAFTALNLHDIYNKSGKEGAVGAMKLVFELLKPGGFLGVIDHHGAANQDNKELHRMQKKDAIDVLTAAGFVVEGDSELLAVPGDDMSKSVFAEEIRGKTNRFLLKVRRPATAKSPLPQ